MSGPTRSVLDTIERPPPPARQWTRDRLLGYGFMGLWALLGVGLLLFLVRAWDAELFARYAPNYVSGLWVTIQLVLISIVLGALLSAPIAYARSSASRRLAWPAYA